MDLLASGREADVFALDAQRVLRRYRDGRPAAREAELLREVVAAGYPAPAVLAVDGPDMVLERVDGPTLAEAVLARNVLAVEAGAIMARLHIGLHAIDWDGGTLVHLDLHPLNIILGPDGPRVVDWANARPGAASLDVAMTALICAEVAVTPGMIPVRASLHPDVTTTMRQMVRSLTDELGRAHLAQLGEATRIRRANPVLTTRELLGLDAAAALVRDPWAHSGDVAL